MGGSYMYVGWAPQAAKEAEDLYGGEGEEAAFKPRREVIPYPPSPNTAIWC